MFTSPKPQGTTSPNLEESIAKLAILGEQAGFTIEQMIGLLSGGLSVETLLELITWRLEIFSSGEKKVSLSRAADHSV